MTSLVKAENAAANVRVLVITASVRHVKAHAPTGNGLRMRPEMVVRKMERRDHAFGVSECGFGTANRRSNPMKIEMKKGMGFTPFQLKFGKRRREVVVLASIGRLLAVEFGFDIAFLGGGCKQVEFSWFNKLVTHADNPTVLELGGALCMVDLLGIMN